ncbi:hypothetical protein RRG08_060518 [Elysia crispata]|uniref:Uncharacterized protein n=1 Tax=Elysia crispata TaxID=231223 RepID=A0AAE1ABS8_9GAST|nr:hypothetical protein RRG08_060518 [Elysia crispata]
MTLATFNTSTLQQMARRHPLITEFLANAKRGEGLGICTFVSSHDAVAMKGRCRTGDRRVKSSIPDRDIKQLTLAQRPSTDSKFGETHTDQGHPRPPEQKPPGQETSTKPSHSRSAERKQPMEELGIG